MWPVRGRTAVRGVVFGLSVLNRVYNFMRICPKQGIGACFPGKFLYLVLPNWLEMNLKLPCAIKFVVYTITNEPMF